MYKNRTLNQFYMIFQSELFCFLREADNPLCTAFGIHRISYNVDTEKMTLHLMTSHLMTSYGRMDTVSMDPEEQKELDGSRLNPDFQ